MMHHRPTKFEIAFCVLAVLFVAARVVRFSPDANMCDISTASGGGENALTVSDDGANTKCSCGRKSVPKWSKREVSGKESLRPQPSLQKTFTASEIHSFFPGVNARPEMCDHGVSGSCTVQPHGDRNSSGSSLWSNEYFNKRFHLSKAFYAIVPAALAASGRPEESPLELGKMYIGRVHALMDFIEWKREFPAIDKCKTALTTDMSDPEIRVLPMTCKVTAYVYNPRTNANDLHHKISVSDEGTEKFDLILLGQTLEHLYNPVLALTMVADALECNGHLFASVPSMNHPHSAPFYYATPTSHGLFMWMKLAGLKVLKLGQFGNAQEIANLGKHPTWWPRTEFYIQKNGRGTVINDPWTPVDLWVLATKTC
jgi:hypothetical protein